MRGFLRKISKSRFFSRLIILRVLAVFIFSSFVIVGVTRAGSLTPSASPASTMHTLQELYDAVAGNFDSTSISATSTGSLIQNLKYIVGNLLWASSSGNIYFTGGNVGIGTTTPQNTLTVVGTANLGTTTISVLTVNTSSSLGATTFTSATGTTLTAINVSSTNLTVGSVTSTQCLHSVNGVVSGTGSDCASGGSTSSGGTN